MPGNQITGTPGRASNVHGEKDETAMPPHDMGKGENTEVAVAGMERNKAAYEFDMGGPEQILRPMVGYPPAQAGTPSKPKDQSIEE